MTSNMLEISLQLSEEDQKGSIYLFKSTTMRPSIAFQFNDSWDLEIQSCLAGNVTPEWFPERVLAPEMIIHGFDLV